VTRDYDSEMQTVLTINSGSSSIKFALFALAASPRELVRGEIEPIGAPGSRLVFRDSTRGDVDQVALDAPSHQAGAGHIVTRVQRWLGERSLAGIGHRMVHGGPRYHEPIILTDQVIADLSELAPFLPSHAPAELAVTQTFRESFPGVPQIACFDTGFHHDLPVVARSLPLPRRYATEGLRRYGFHGLSYQFLLGELERVAGTEAARGRLVLAHLGSGASLAAVHRGQPVDTTMGFTPIGGLMMGNRSGDLDPGVLFYLAGKYTLTLADLHDLVSRQAGLLGVSETSADMRDLLSREAHDARAAEAVALFCYQVKKGIGAFAAALGGLDCLVFAGGIGERAPVVRARVCEGLGHLGVHLDADRNAVNGAIISRNAAPVTVRVIATDEQFVLARAVERFLHASERQPA